MSDPMVLLEAEPAEPAESTQALPPVRREAERRADLLLMKRRATGLLLLMTAAFVALVLSTDGSGWSGYVRSAVEASMVGGLADWFAVTALFRHPLGLPIPHTAVIRERKDQFGRTLGDFMQENFLNAAVLTQRVRAANITHRTAVWLADPHHADALAAHVADVLVGLADAVRDEDVQRVVHEQLAKAVDDIPLAPAAGKMLRLVTADGRYQELVDAGLHALGDSLREHETSLRAQFGERSPAWLPGFVEDRIFDRLLEGVCRLIAEVEADQSHPLRARVDTWLADLIARLETSPEMLERGEALKRDLLRHPQLREWSATIWRDVKVGLREQASVPDSTVRVWLRDAIVATGQRLCDDPALVAKADELVESGVRYLAEHFHEEVSDLVTGTIARWDGAETSDKLELLLGRDLQFIRINGTVVGGLAGLAIHAVATALG